MEIEVVDDGIAITCCNDDYYTPRQIIKQINEIQSVLGKIKEILGPEDESYNKLSDISNVAKIRKYSRDIKCELTWLIRGLNRQEDDLIRYDSE